MKIDQRNMGRMMKQMGMNVSDIDAEEVIIRTADKDIVISEPHVSKVKVMGQEMFQITGEVSEREREDDDDDVDMVAEQAGVSREEAREMLKETHGDIAQAIMKLKG